MRFIDSLSEWVVLVSRWFVVALTLVVLFEVFSRYLFGRPTVWGFDTAMMLYSALFLLSGAWVTKIGAHIRVDVIYNRFSERVRNGIELVYYIFFYIPLCVIISWSGWIDTYSSYVCHEISNTSQWGEPIWIWRSTIPIGFSFMLLQGVSELVKLIRKRSENRWVQSS